MNFIETNNSWKGKLWGLWILWPIFGIQGILEFNQIEDPHMVYIQIGIVVLWVIWIIAAKKPIEFLIDLFK